MRPSELIDIEDPYAAYCFDDACDLWGSYIEQQTHEATKNIKNEAQRAMVRMATMKVLLTGPNSEDAVETPASSFRDPAATFGK